MYSPFRTALFVIPYFLFLFLFSAPSAQAEIVRTLKLGAVGPDVKELQVLLNGDPVTRIATVGPGAPGNETEFFGALTKKAVEAFQAKYAPEVLFPGGIWQPTGIVGFYSRNKLNALIKILAQKESPSSEVLVPASVKSAIPSSFSGATVGESQPSTGSLYSIFATKSKPLIFNLSRYQARRGASVSVQGSGFLSVGNSIVFNADHRVDNIPSPSGSTLVFTVPDTVPYGAYNVSVQNKNGSSFVESYGNFFTVTDTPSDPPKVFKVSPPSVLYSANSTITIEGEGFSSAGNDVFTDFGIASNVISSDGKTLKVPLSAFTGFAQAGTQAGLFAKSNISTPVFVVVKNSAGISSTRVSFLLQY